MAEGKISPQINTTVTDISTAAQEGTSSSRKMGRASFAIVLNKSSVTSKRWWSLTSGLIRRALALSLLSLRRASGVEQSRFAVCSITWRAKGSMDTSPNVKPAASAALMTQTNTIATNNHTRTCSNSSSSCSTKGLMHTGRESHSPLLPQVMVISRRFPPHTKAPSEQVSLYSPPQAVLPVHVPASSLNSPQSWGTHVSPLSLKPSVHSQM
mmetsp:Transcript_50755/g.146385  ORF Transcript_50755/g.146385 Transcript_50755/m.146385 type:complete len:211 (-) Transcript_50755:686-1318(-)